jgi:hypothetical protein
MIFKPPIHETESQPYHSTRQQQSTPRTLCPLSPPPPASTTATSRHHLPFPIVSPVAFAALLLFFTFWQVFAAWHIQKKRKCLGQRCTGLWFRFVDIHEHAKIKLKCVSYHRRIQLDPLELGKIKTQRVRRRSLFGRSLRRQLRRGRGG